MNPQKFEIHKMQNEIEINVFHIIVLLVQELITIGNGIFCAQMSTCLHSVSLLAKFSNHI